MSLKNDIAEARKTHDIVDVLGTDKKSIICPLPQHIHHSNTPSFSVFWKRGFQWWKCHGNCNAEGDIIDLVGYLRITGYDPKNTKDIRAALALVDQRYEMKIVIPEKEVSLNGSEWIDFVPPGIEVIDYARNRGMTAETIHKFRVGQSGMAMTMPAFHDGLLRGIKFRNLTPHGLRYWSMEGSRQSLFNFDAVNMQTGTVFVVKAEIPCMIMDQEGFKACAPTGGEGGWVESWRTGLALAHKVVIGDNDAPGKKLGEKRAALLGADLKFPPEEYKDVDQWYLADKTHCLNTIHHWEEE
jgi:hypothetical protein